MSAGGAFLPSTPRKSFSTLNLDGAMPREKIILACGECKNRNYFTTKNKRLHPDKMEIKKFDPVARKHVAYKETKIK